jgi:hypothetical protein
MRRVILLLLVISALLPCAARAQDINVLHPVSQIEQWLLGETLNVMDVRGSRMAQDRTQRVVIGISDSVTMLIKWAKSARGGAGFNNEPRYEIAAYEIQKLFLDQSDYVVPVTVGRAVPVEWYSQYDRDAFATFDGTKSVVLVLQYWLTRVTNDQWWDENRFVADSVYARHLGDFNILTYLIHHSDSNSGNYLISQEPTKPRVFSVDNGVAFRSPIGDRGFAWRELRLDRLPRATVERLRTITRDQLDSALGVILHFDLRNGELVSGEPAANLGDNRGVRRTREAIQFGLTKAEINDVEARLRRLLERVDDGKIALF